MDAVSYDRSEGIAEIGIDDGKVNAMSIPLLGALHDAFDRAEREQAVVLLRGREGIFSAGFDLDTFASGRERSIEMLRLGATLVERMLSFPAPVVAACTGHAYPMGAFLLLAADRRVGCEGDYRLGLNEVAISMTLPLFAVETARQRLTPAAFQRCVTGDMFAPREAAAAGFLDEVVAPDDVLPRARQIAQGLTKIGREAHAATKLRVRAQALEALRSAIDSELRP